MICLAICFGIQLIDLRPVPCIVVSIVPGHVLPGQKRLEGRFNKREVVPGVSVFVVPFFDFSCNLFFLFSVCRAHSSHIVAVVSFLFHLFPSSPGITSNRFFKSSRNVFGVWKRSMKGALRL